MLIHVQWDDYSVTIAIAIYIYQLVFSSYQIKHKVFCIAILTFCGICSYIASYADGAHSQ